MNAVWLTAVFSVLVAGLDERGLRHTTPLSEQVRLSLAANREGYYPGESLKLRLFATNTSPAPVAAYLLLDPAISTTKVYYRPPGASAFVELEGLRDKRVHGMAERRVLQAGEAHSRDVTVSTTGGSGSASRFVLNDVGRYEFRVTYVDTPEDPTNGILDSDTLALDVVEPPASERAAQAAYTTDLAYVAQFKRGLSYLSPEDTRAAAEFVRRFPDSRYAVPVLEGLRLSLDYRQRIGRATEEEQALWKQLFKDHRAPVLSVSAAPSRLWPPNGKMVPISVTVNVTHDHDPNPVIKLVSIACDDQCNPTVDIGNAAIEADDRLFELRSQRLGASAGRTYTITYSAADASGNETTATTKVTVPHDQRDKK